MNIPKKDVISFVLREALQQGAACSQHELSVMLNKRLRKGNPGYSISPARGRAIAMETPGIEVSIITRKGSIPKRCPACGHSLRKVYTRNLNGRKVLLRLSCTKCPYRGSGGKWIPARYVFRAYPSARTGGHR